MLFFQIVSISGMGMEGREKAGGEVRIKTGKSSCSFSPQSLPRLIEGSFCLLLPSLSTFNIFFYGSILFIFIIALIDVHRCGTMFFLFFYPLHF